MFCTTEKTRDDAERSCLSVGMHLVHIGSMAEERWVYSTALASGMTADLMSGGTDLGGDDWQWLDGTRFWSGLADGKPINDAYAHFRKGEPNGSGGCVVLQTDHLWDDQDCTWTRQYVCEAPGGSDSIVPYDCSMPAPLNCTCKAIGSSTYLFCNEEVGFQVARVVCLSAGMHLARIESATEDQQVRAAADQLGIGTYFADGNDLAQRGQWRWSDPAQTVFWTSGAGGAGGSVNGGGMGGSSAGAQAMGGQSAGGAGGNPASGGTGAGTSSTRGAVNGAYVNWAPGQPNGSGDCLVVLPGPAWDDTDCIGERYVCERP